MIGAPDGASAPAQLVGLVCYQASHYCAIVRDEESGTWRQFDDTAVTVVGECGVGTCGGCAGRAWARA